MTTSTRFTSLLHCFLGVLATASMILAQVPAIEPVVDETGRITAPFSGTATSLGDGSGLIRIEFSGRLEDNTRVRANLLIYRLVDKGERASSRALWAPLAVSETTRSAPEAARPTTHWSATLNISPESLALAEVELYIDRTGAPSDTGRWYKVKLSRLLPPSPSTRPVDSKG